jgi:hypothetical protein
VEMEGNRNMDLKDLGYILYMENEELKKKDFNSLTEYEKVNLEINPYKEIQTPTQKEKLMKSTKKSQNITPNTSK